VTESGCFEIKRNWERIVERRMILIFGGLNNLCTCLDRPVGLHGVEAARISRQSAHEGDKVSLTHRPPLPPTRYPWYSFL